MPTFTILSMFVSLSALSSAAPVDDICAQYEPGHQQKKHPKEQKLSLISDGGQKPMKPAEIKALCALWIATGKSSDLIGWGDGDPCLGNAPEGQGNAQGFGAWKGVSCAPCKGNPGFQCATNIWLHQKRLKGIIPEDFKDMSDLQWLLMSANNFTGPMPRHNWHTMPTLRYLDISYNQIDGDLPLAELSKISTLQYVLVNDNSFDSIVYEGGGFPSLSNLIMNNNKKLSGKIPSGFSKLPSLRSLQIHTTNLTGPVPGGHAWPKIESLLISATGGLCGPLPSVCSKESVFCDITHNFPAC